jgi:hypothetical protein
VSVYGDSKHQCKAWIKSAAMIQWARQAWQEVQIAILQRIRCVEFCCRHEQVRLACNCAEGWIASSASSACQLLGGLYMCGT